MMLAYLLFVILVVMDQVVISTSQETCATGKFGADCGSTCNCLVPSQCNNTKASLGCSGACDVGYADPPGCQAGCNGSTFGSNCATPCHCKPNVGCSRWSGQCNDGECAAEYYESNCQKLKPQLPTAPNITENTCSALTLIWTQFRWGVDVGDAKATAYRVFAHYGTTNLQLSVVANKPGALTNTATYSTQLNVSSSYSFSVTPVFMFIGNEEDGVPSPRTGVVTRTCIQTVPSPADSKVIPTSNFGLNVTWSTTEHADVLTQCRISYTRLRYGICPSASGSETTVNVAFSTGFYFIPLNTAWTEYNVTLNGLDSSGNLSPNIFFLWYTEETTPTVSVSSLTASPLETSANISWTAPTCQGQGGVLTNYVLQVERLSDKSLVLITPSTGILSPTVLSYNVTGLIVQTQYSARVGFLTSKGLQSPYTTFNFTTTGTVTTTVMPTTSKGTTEVPTTASTSTATTASTTTATTTVATTATTTPAPGAPSNLQISQIGSNWAYFTWNRPQVAPPETRYKLTLVSTSTSTSDTTTNVFYNVTGLTKGSTYSVYVSSVLNNIDQGISNTVRLVFRAGISGTPVASVTGIPSSVTVSWTAVTGSFPPLSYSITASAIMTRLPSQVAVNSTLTASSGSASVVFSDLSPASQYVITITPIYSNDVQGISRSTVAFWTSPGPMTNPLPVPEVTSVGTTGFQILLKPIDYTAGPLEYYIAISSNSSSARRRKRAVQTSTLGLPAGSTILTSIPAPTASGSTFDVGNGTSPNDGLQESTVYNIFWVATSEAGNLRVSKYSTTRVTTAAASLAWIAAIIVILILIIIIIIIIIWCWRKQRFLFDDKKDQNIDLKLNNGVNNGPIERHLVPVYYKNWSDAERLNDARFMVVDPEYGPRDLKVDSLKNPDKPHDYESFEKEYRNLPVGLEKPCNAGRLSENQPKNRNPSILPYDHCRVTLDRDGTGSVGSDYVNASFIDGYLRKRAYIAAQSPFDEDTCEDFWLMVYQYNVQQVVMMTEMLEEATVKCTQYWPDCGQAAAYGSVYVTCTEEEEFAYYTVRFFQIVLRGTRMSAMMPMKQYQFHGWPDHGVPLSPIPLLEMYTRVKMDMQPQMGPLIVHCGTGISRTAVFIALDSLLQQASHENVVNVYKFCIKMRRCRPNMIRTARQYMFLYDLIFESLLSSNQIANLNVQETFRQLSAKNPSTGHSFLWEQHCLLEKYTLSNPDSQCVNAMLNENRNKNRFSTILPSDEYRVQLFSTPSSSGYINAVFVDGVFTPDDIIMTQTPLQKTLADFWCMVRDHQVTCIVDTQPAHRGREGAVDWYPGPELTRRLDGGMHIRSSQILHVEYLPGISVREVTIDNSKAVVKIYSIDEGVWSDPYAKVPTDRSVLVSLVQAVRQDKDRSGPLTVVCLDGATRAGLFTTCFLAAEKLYHDHYVDVFRTIKAVKMRRQQSVPHLEQYKLVYKFLWDFVRRFMPDKLKIEMSRQGLHGHLPEGDLESVYSHTMYPILHTEQTGTLNSSGIHYRYANANSSLV